MASPGNWMHLQYQSRLQARKALSKDGKVFGDAIMVGVKPCIDKVSAHFDPPTLLSVCLPSDWPSTSGDIEVVFVSVSECDGQQCGHLSSPLHLLLLPPFHSSLSHQTAQRHLQELW